MMMMGDGHWLAGMLTQTIVLAIVLFYPVWRILGRAGQQQAFAFLIFIPWIGGLIVLYLLAFQAWGTARGGNG